MVLESDIKCLSKAIHVINFDFKNEGRRVSNEITVSDISVSRSQASIKLINNKVFVRDCDSRFGTFIKVNGLLELTGESFGLSKNTKHNFIIPI
jgi:hypothetical protein